MRLSSLRGRPHIHGEVHPTASHPHRARRDGRHIDVSRAADAVMVAPASADFLAKLAHGRADDLLSALCLAQTYVPKLMPENAVVPMLSAVARRHAEEPRQPRSCLATRRGQLHRAPQATRG